MKKSQKGYTLIELLLLVAIIAIVSASIYSYYSRKAEDAKVTALNNTLKNIDKQVRNSFSSITDFGGLSNAYALATNMLPAQMTGTHDPNSISNTFGGGFTLANSTFSGINGYSVTMDKLPNSVCTKLATSDFAQNVQQVIVNGTIIKNINTPMTPANMANAATRCAGTQNANILVYKNDSGNSDLDPSSSGLNRNKELPQYISEVYTSSPSGASGSCGGGSAWNGEFCSCPVNTEWNGSSCVAFGTATPQPGTCPRGQGWTPGTHTCAPLPYGNSTNQYSGGKNVPGNITTPVVSPFPTNNPVAPVTTPVNAVTQTQTIVNNMPASNIEVIDGRVIVTSRPILKNNGMITYLSSCVNGYYDNTSQRCIPN